MFSFPNPWGLISEEHFKTFFDVAGHAVPVVKAFFSRKPKTDIPTQQAPRLELKVEIPAEKAPEQISEIQIATLDRINQFGGTFESRTFIDSKTRQRVAEALRKTLPLILLLALLGGMTVAARDGPLVSAALAAVVLIWIRTAVKSHIASERSRQNRSLSRRTKMTDTQTIRIDWFGMDRLVASCLAAMTDAILAYTGTAEQVGAAVKSRFARRTKAADVQTPPVRVTGMRRTGVDKLIEHDLFQMTWRHPAIN